MILISVKNYLKSLGFYFIPLGVMTFFAVIAVGCLIPSGISLVQQTYESIASKIGGIEYEWSAVSSVLASKATDLFADPSQLAGLIGNSSQLSNLLKETAMEAFGVTELTNEVVTLIRDCVTQLLIYLVMVLVITILGLFFGFILLKILLRRYLTDTNMIKAILVSILDSIILIALASITTLIDYNSARVWTYIFIAIAVIIFILISLIEAYLFYGIKKVRFFDIFNFKNAVTLFVGDLIDIALGAGLIALCLLIPYRFVGIFIAVPFAGLLLCVLGLNAEVYASSKVKERKLENKIRNKIETENEKED